MVLKPSINTTLRYLITRIEETGHQNITYHDLINATISTNEMLEIMLECGRVRIQQENHQRRLEHIERELRELREAGQRQQWQTRLNSIKRSHIRIDHSLGSCKKFQSSMRDIQNLSPVYRTMKRNLKSTDKPSEKLAIALLTITTKDLAVKIKSVGNGSDDISFYSQRKESLKLTVFGVIFKNLKIFSENESVNQLEKLIEEAIKLI